MFRVIIAGSRGFWSQDLMDRTMDSLLQNKQAEPIEILSDNGRGAPRFGEIYARKRGYSLKHFDTDWDQYGKAAPYLRNLEMTDQADACVVFWDGETRFEKYMINAAKFTKIPVRVIKYRSPQRELFNEPLPPG